MSSKIANLCDIDLNFSDFISDVNGDNPEKFLKVSMHRSCISKHRFFAILVCTFQTGPVMYIGFDFVLPYRYKHLVVQIDFHSFFLSWISRMVFLIDTMVLCRNQVISTIRLVVVWFLLFVHFVKNKQWFLKFAYTQLH